MIFFQGKAEIFTICMGALLYESLQIWPYMSTLWTCKIAGKNAHVYVYGYKVRLHVYKICVNVAALDNISIFAKEKKIHH